MLNIDSIYILLFLSGLFGGVGHCTGMCGPLIITYMIFTGISPLQRLKPHLIYHSGRLMSYCLIGGFMGLTGSFVTTVSSISPIQSIAMVLTGAVMVFMGLSMTGLIKRLKILKNKNTLDSFTQGPEFGLPPIVTSLLKHGSPFPLGLINGLIPCGLSYTAFIGAAGLGSSQKEPLIGFLKGLFLLLIFGIGTTPGLLFISWLSLKGTTLFRNRLYKLAGLFVVMGGLVFLWRALRN